VRVVDETERLAWIVLQVVNRTQAKGSTVRLVVPRAPEVAYELDPVPDDEEFLSVEEYLLQHGYVAPVDIGLTRGTYTITPAGLNWLDRRLPESSEQRPETASHAHQEQSAGAAEMPERPTLAPNVRLVGELPETRFRDRQWLIQRDGRFIQLTELLYRVAEQANGERTLEEIAAGVTESTDWMVSADNVRQLIQTKLIPMGLIVTADGSFVPHDQGQTRSPLMLNMRARIIGPRIIDPLTKVLQILYAPAVLIPVVTIIAVAHAWLYFVHGVVDSVREVIYTPGLLAPVLVVLLVASIFHEFGHASALRYGGGKTRGMGFGFYLVYPALYTDTTDSYRLGRWARVRTDLGGFYFHLIFTLGIMGFYLLTGWEFLLVAVLLINLDILYQCLPFVRFDGYWALADLTGIPDFFSQMGAFLRSLLPGSRWKGSKLPELKPWVKAVFATYVIVTIPVLALLLFLLVTHLPGIATTFWESLSIQARTFSSAVASSDPLGAAVSIVQILMLGLQVLAAAYLLYEVSRMLILAVWMRISSARRHEGEGV
jgi:putative peptide zinc metalloprotease protein